MADLIQVKISYSRAQLDTFEFFELPAGSDRGAEMAKIRTIINDTVRSYRDYFGPGFVPGMLDLHQILRADQNIRLSRAPFMAIAAESDLVVEVA